MGEIPSQRSAGLGPLARDAGRSSIVQFATPMALVAMDSEIVDEGIAEDTTSVRKVDGVEIEVADIRAEEVVARMVKKMEGRVVGYMIAGEMGDWLGRMGCVYLGRWMVGVR